MDSSGRLRYLTEEEVNTMEDILHPVDSLADLPAEKRAVLEAFHSKVKFKNRHDKRSVAKQEGVDWAEYQIFVLLKRSEEFKEFKGG